MNLTQHLLGKLAEEAAEVAQIALKAQYFGLDEVYAGQVGEPLSNAERIHRELDDLMAIVAILNRDHGLGYAPNIHWQDAKEIKVNQYAEYSASLGLLTK